jgi:hypothetical protein
MNNEHPEKSSTSTLKTAEENFLVAPMILSCYAYAVPGTRPTLWCDMIVQPMAHEFNFSFMNANLGISGWCTTGCCNDYYGQKS